MSRAIPIWLPIAAGFVFAATWMLTPARQAPVAAADAGSAVAFPEERGKPAPIPASWRAEKPEDPSPGPPAAAGPPPSAGEALAVEASVYYPGCNQARAAGAAPIHRGQPGYRAGMDGDGDGIACEPVRPR
ncbi:MAG TPA: excalibur calcium-binding domain-containing protein [Allosphingosinicella sp.]|jgi:hypothetical protein